MRTMPILVAALVLVGSCTGSESSSGPTPSSEAATARQPSTSASAGEDGLDLVILSDSLSRGGWPDTWAGLMQADLGVDVDLHDLSVDGKVDYDSLLQRSDVRLALQDAEVVFISPDPDYLRDACPTGTSPECVTEFSAEYRSQWAGWLDDISELTDGAMLRSAQAWVWLAPDGRRAGLVEFMDQMATETRAHGGLVADINTVLTGSDHSEDPPPESIDATGHLTELGADLMAETLHGLGYDTAT